MPRRAHLPGGIISWTRCGLLPAALLLMSLIGACSKSDEVPPEIASCAAGLFAKYNPKDLEQCKAVCIACSKGVTTTCSTACTLKGAR